MRIYSCEFIHANLIRNNACSPIVEQLYCLDFSLYEKSLKLISLYKGNLFSKILKHLTSNQIELIFILKRKNFL